MEAKRSREVLDRVVARGKLESVGEAERIVAAVTGAMALSFEGEAWQVVASLMAGGPLGEPREPPVDGARTLRDFFRDIGDRERVSSATAAGYARIVAEAMAETMTPGELRRLREGLDDDFLALFETDHRGELTDEGGYTEGSRIVEHVREGPERFRDD